MAYDPPTYADFIARFPIFNNVALYPQAVVEALIVEATNNIDNSWIEEDYKPAIQYLTAHMLALDNSSEGSEVQIGGLTNIAAESFAGMSVSYKTADSPPGSAAGSSFGSTSYGRRYWALLQKNKPAVVVA
jgi:hypothetical protein